MTKTHIKKLAFLHCKKSKIFCYYDIIAKYWHHCWTNLKNACDKIKKIFLIDFFYWKFILTDFNFSYHQTILLYCIYRSKGPFCKILLWKKIILKFCKNYCNFHFKISIKKLNSHWLKICFNDFLFYFFCKFFCVANFRFQ